MVKSMYAAVAGLRTHQSKMDVIGNNIANVNTYGYKKERTAFSDTYYSTNRAASEATNVKGGANPSQVGYGVKMGGVNNIVTTGGAAITDNPTDCMISGNGYFLVGNYNSEGYTKSSQAEGVGKQGTLKNLNLTRVGMFTFDGQGNFVDSNAEYVYGYASARGLQALKDRDKDGKVKEPLSFTIPENKATGAKAQKYTVVPHNGVDGKQVSWYIYKGDAPANPTGKEDNFAFSLKVDDYDPRKTDNLFVFDEKSDFKDNKLYTIDEKTGYIKNIATGVVQATSDKLKAIQIPRIYTMNGFFDQDGKPLSVTLFNENDKVEVNAFVPKMDAGGKPAVDPLTKKPIYELKKQTIDGATYWNVANPMKLSSISIGSDGTVTGIDGSTNSVITIAKIAVADIPNPMALEALGDNYFKAKANTGLIEARKPGEGSTGKLASGTLEMSNVDLANEFTDMITTQRGYQANSRIITVTDSMLEELVNLKRG